MGGGLSQLVAYGAQDVYLTGNPQITFFKVVYRRHTNFSMEDIQQTVNGTIAANNRTSTTISRNGDLVGKTWIKVPTQAGVLANNSGGDIGHAMIIDASVEIGGQQIDKHDGHWMSTWAQLTEPIQLELILILIQKSSPNARNRNTFSNNGRCWRYCKRRPRNHCCSWRTICFLYIFGLIDMLDLLSLLLLFNTMKLKLILTGHQP